MSGITIGLEIDGDGAHPAAWRAARHAPNHLLTPDRLAAVGRRAQAARFGFVTLDDSTPDTTTRPPADVAGRFDPVTAAAYLSATTTTLGLVPVVHTAHAEPFHVSNQLASLDHASRGRAGWLVGTEASAARAHANGVRHETDPAAIATEAGDVVDAAARLWDSWQDDAVIADEATGRFLDADRVHHVDFRGATFGVRGPALVPRPPQGRVVVFAPAGTLPAELVDVETVTGRDEAAVRVAAAGAAAGRVLAEVEVLLDADGVAAADRLAALDAHTRWPAGERLRWVGPATGLARLLLRLAPHVDAVRLVPAVLDVELPVLAREVLPALGGSLRVPGPDSTLRALFGLARPASRYARLPAE